MRHGIGLTRKSLPLIRYNEVYFQKVLEILFWVVGKTPEVPGYTGEERLE